MNDDLDFIDVLLALAGLVFLVAFILWIMNSYIGAANTVSRYIPL